MPARAQIVRNYVTQNRIWRGKKMIEKDENKKKIRMGIVGYGNLGKACEKIALSDENIELVGIFSRRSGVKSNFRTKVYLQDDVFKFDMDVVLLCVGSQSDLQDTAARIATKFNTIDSFDTHAEMAKHIDRMSKIAYINDRLCFVGIGWDPGLFSLVRALFDGVIQNSKCQTFWGKGVSQGHSEAIRRINGVVNAKQYTIPKKSALQLVREGVDRDLTPREKHLRECYVVAEKNADKEEIERKIVNMPNYFAQYDTIVHFVDEKYFDEHCSGLEHGGFVLANGIFADFKSKAEFFLKLESNPTFTAGVLVAYAKALAKEYENGQRGVKTILDVPIADLLQGEWIDKVKRFV